MEKILKFSGYTLWMIHFSSTYKPFVWCYQEVCLRQHVAVMYILIELNG